MESIQHIDIETEFAKSREMKKARRQDCDIDYTHGARPKVLPSSLINVKEFSKQLSSMHKTEEATLTRYTNMPEIELKSLIKIPSTKVFKRNKLMKFKAKLAASTAEKMDASDCGLLNIEFKEIGT